MYKVSIHELPEGFLFGAGKSKKDPTLTSGRDRLRRSVEAPGSAELKQWQRRAEELSKRYAALLQTYKQLKAKAAATTDWRARCQKLLNELLRVVGACEFTNSVDRTSDPSATLESVLAGVQQLRERVLTSLCDLGFLEMVDPEPGVKFDSIRCIAVGAARDDDLSSAVIEEVIECGFAHNDQVVKPAKVKVAPGGTTASPDLPQR